MLSFVRPALVAAGCALVAAATLPACAARVDPDAPSVLLNNGQVPGVGDKLINRGDYNDALKLIAEGLKSIPLSAQLRFQRCVVYERMGDRDKAINGFEQFIRTYPEIPEAYNNLAGLYSRNGNLVRAEELLVKAVALRPGFAVAHMNLGNLYLAKAKNAYNTAIKTGGNKEKLNANIKLLNKLLGEKPTAIVFLRLSSDMLKRICLMRHIMKIANRFRLTFPAALAAVVVGGSAVAAPKDEPIAEISTSLGDFVERQDAPRAPITVANFIRYADEGFYDGTIFHRVIDGFMVQGGGFTPDLKQKRAPHPAIVNAARGGLPNLRGTIAMARTSYPHSATSQIYLNVADNDFLNADQAQDGQGYAVFGRGVSGTDTVDKIAAVKTGVKNRMSDVPLEPVVIKSAKVLK